MNFAGMIDHTLLRADATKSEITKLTEEAKKYEFASVCINPTWVAYAKEQLAGTKVKVCTVIGAPLTSWIANRLDSIKGPYVVAHAIVFLSWSGFLFFHGKPPYFMAIILFLIIGFGIGASSLTFATVRVSFPIKEVGVASGFANTGGFISAILLPSIFGKILDHFHTASSSVGYFYGFIIPALFSMLGLIGGLLIQKDRLKE